MGHMGTSTIQGHHTTHTPHCTPHTPHIILYHTKPHHTSHHTIPHAYHTPHIPYQPHHTHHKHYTTSQHSTPYHNIPHHSTPRHATPRHTTHIPLSLGSGIWAWCPLRSTWGPNVLRFMTSPTPSIFWPIQDNIISCFGGAQISTFCFTLATMQGVRTGH